MEAEVDDTGQGEVLVRNSSFSSMIDYVRNFIPGYQSKEVDEECNEKIGDKLKKKRLKSKRRSSPLNKKDYPSTISKRGRCIGQNRSVVRYIGSNIPIAPTKRAYFELLDNSRRAFISSASNFLSANLDHVRQHVDQVKYRVVPTLADIGQLVWDDLKVFDEDEDEEIDEDAGENGGGEEEVDENDQLEITKNPAEKKKKSSKGEPQDGTKITELEDELAKLRAQIAMIVSASQAPQAAPMPQQPTPIAIVPPIMSVPPPPPPPPPSVFNPKIEIKKVAKKEPVEEESVPNLSDVLKGLSSVKLKSVPNRSPGGTPMRNKSNNKESNDPADIIARALREKFRNSRTCYDSPETDSSPSSFSPPGFSPSPRKHKKSPKVVSSMARSVPRPRPKPRSRTQKKTNRTEESGKSEKTKLF